VRAFANGWWFAGAVAAIDAAGAMGLRHATSRAKSPA